MNIIKKLLILPLAVISFSIPLIGKSDFTAVSSKQFSSIAQNNGNVVGNLAGKFFVNPQGNAIYDIPLAAPPGTAGMSPTLSLHYDSSAGNSMLGMGFNLQGLTAITRVNSNYAQNGEIHAVNFTYADRFSFNGQQLVAINASSTQYGADGVEYRTYIDSQAKIISQGVQGNGPAGFMVQIKGGQTAWYGTTQDSQILAQGKNTVAVWALAKIQDQAGNYTSYHYIQDQANGSYYPSEIDYTGNDAAKVAPYNSVKFIYEENRADSIISYTAGSLFKVTKRLTEIQMYQGSTLVYDYKINYELSPNTFKSRITSVQECDGSGNCLRPLTFNWQTNQAGWVEASSFAPPEQFVQHGSLGADPHVTFDLGARFVDVRGNGLPEQVASRGVPFYPNPISYTNAWVLRGNHWEQDTEFSPKIPIAGLDDMGPLTVGTEFTLPMANGGVDMVQSCFLTQPEHYTSYYRSTASGWVEQPQSDPANTNISFGIIPVAKIMDAEADGHTWAVQLHDRRPNWNKAYELDNQTWVEKDSYIPPRSFLPMQGVQIINLDNSGLPDLMIANNQEHITWRNTGIASNTPGASWVQANDFPPPSNFLFKTDVQSNPKDGGGRTINLYGTGLADLIMAQNGDHENWINTGAGWIHGPGTMNPPTDVTHGEGYDDGVQFIDVTGSGKPAWLQCSGSSYNGQCRAWLNENGAWVEDDDYAPKVQMTDNNGQDNGVRFVDLLGTGFEDMVVNNGNQKDAWLNAAQTKPDVITHIQDALGDNLQIQYKPITDNSIYTKGSNAQYPNMDMQAAIYVVAQTASDTAVTPTSTAAIAKKLSRLINSNIIQHITSYHYENALFNHLGWGFLGFGQMTTTDQSTGLSSVITYSQDTEKHTVGLPLETRITTSNGTVIDKQSSTLSTQSYGNGQLNGSWFYPYVSQTVETTYDLNTTALMSTKTTNTQMDDYANPIDVLETATDSTGTYSTEIKNNYTNINSKWWMGQLDQSVVTSITPASKGSRKTTYTYDANTGFLSSSTSYIDAMQDNSAVKTLSKIYKRDVFGHIIETDTEGSDIVSRSDKIQYDPNGEFVISKTNVLNQTAHFEYDPCFGAVTKVTDPNGLIETNSYDSFGRLQSTMHADGTVSTIEYRWAAGDNSAPSGSVYEIIQTQTASPTKVSYHDELDREIAQASQGFGGKWIWQLTHYNEIGLVVGRTMPFYAGDPIYETTSQYDALARVVLSTSPDGGQIKQSYNGYVTTLTNPKNQTMVRKNNVRGNLIQSTDAEGHVTSYQYDAFNHLTQLIDSKGHVSTMQYNNMGQKLSMTDVDRGKSVYNYDVLNELLSQTDAKNQTTTYQYDLLGRMIARTDPSQVTSTWQYDNAPHAIGKLVRENGVSNLIRTPVGKTANGISVIQQRIAAPTPLQKLLAAKDDMISYSRTFVYDQYSRPISMTTNLNAQNYTENTSYDPGTGKISTITYPDQVGVLYHYDAAGYVDQLADAQSGKSYLHITAMDAAGHVLSKIHSNGLITQYTYDPKNGFLLTIETIPTQALLLQQAIFPSDHKTNANEWKLQLINKKQTEKINPPAFTTSNALAPIQNIQYQYDLLGNVTDKNDVVLNVKDHYDYDELNRIIDDQIMDQTHNQSSALNYTYDELGNIINKSDVGVYTYANNAAPHAITSIAGHETDTFQYDANGNQVQAVMKNTHGTITRNVSYTSFDVPKIISQNDDKNINQGIVNFYYDANHARFMRQDQVMVNNQISKTTTLYLDNSEIDTTTDSTGVHNTYKTYIGDTEIINAEGAVQRYDILKDNINSTSVVTDQNGNVVQRFHYDPFGEQQLVQGSITDRTSITRYGFTGQEEVTSGDIDLIHLNGRMYDPHLGRFLSADPVIQDPANSQSLNRYSYCLNNPLVYTDLTGFSWWNRVLHAITHPFDHPFDPLHIINSESIATVLEIAATAVATVASMGATLPMALAYFAEAAAFNGMVSYAQTGSLSIGLKTAAFTFISECVWSGVGVELRGANWEESTLAHGVVGGSLNELEGGSFKNGFMSAAVTQALAGPISSIDSDGKGLAPIMSRGLASGIVGGTVAAETGGNFENGMVTGAFSEMFNDELDKQPGQNPMGSLIRSLNIVVSAIGNDFLIPLSNGINDLAGHVTVDTNLGLSAGGFGGEVGGSRTSSGIDIFTASPGNENTGARVNANLSVNVQLHNMDESGYVTESYVSLGVLKFTRTISSAGTNYSMGIGLGKPGLGTTQGYIKHYDF